MIKLSIIIPTYNVEDFIVRCLDSCLDQDINNDEYEIIIVNDGSKDNSINIAEQYVSRYNNIHIVHRDNGGLSAARNTGLSKAHGEYVWFLDSDDTIEPNCLKELINRVQLLKLDVLCFTLKLIYPDESEKIYNILKNSNQNQFEYSVLTGKDFIQQVYMPASACVALFKRQFLIDQELKFVEGILHEDQEFTPRAYCLAERISIIEKAYYNYYQREGSIMKSNRNTKRCQDLLKIADSLYAFAKNRLKDGSPEYISIMKRVYFCVTQSLAFYSKESFPLTSYSAKPYYPMTISYLSGSLKYKIILANISLKLYLFLHRITHNK